MPSQGFIKHLLKAHPDIANDELVEMVEAAADVYARYYVNGNLQDPAPDAKPWSLPAALECFESFYVLQGSSAAMEPVSLFQVQLPRMFQVRVMCALTSRRYGVSSGDPSTIQESRSHRPRPAPTWAPEQ